MPYTIFTGDGYRKYLTAQETESFIGASSRFSSDVQAFCLMIAYTGCRISEALALTSDSIDLTSNHVIIRSLKKRGKSLHRIVPLPGNYMVFLKRWMRSSGADHELLWPWSRMTGYRHIREVMRAANIDGRHASPKGLRHGFGVRAIESSVPLNLVQRWLGHAHIKTTAIYTNALGAEERRIASRMWKDMKTDRG
ncbi:tyrosine-type recombinase/integrase [Sphingomonas sp. Leaf21]|uniref:tyrosine-type recombinase/integrase n=1 Tax=Sphingomonas sp. Leaf21 TaxID=2876550 RepID=UPI001E306DB4|nr:site-specific integrase [Sphingomonas sp. Leaf21]